MTRTWTGSDGGIDWTVELARDDLLPGRLVPGRVRLMARDRVHGRAVILTLRGEERWKYETTTSNGQTTTTTVHTGRDDLPAIPIRLAGEITLAAGEVLDLPFELPSPPLGPPTVVGDTAAVEWSIEVKLDREGFDASIQVPVRVLQPVALLRAGVVRVAPFALYGAAEGEGSGGLTGTIELDPVPIAAGQPFRGRVAISAASPVKARSIRGELLVDVKVTVSGGLKETITGWTGQLSGPVELSGDHILEFTGVLDAATPPTVVLPHSTVAARFVVIVDRRLAPDHRLGRDVAVATTLEL